MKTELFYLTCITVFTGLLWLPYVLNRIATIGLLKAVGYDAPPNAMAPWATRLFKAHMNAIENLVPFAVLVLVAVIANATNAVTAGACMVYFWARVVHAVAYTLAIPWLRTLAFFIGFLAQAAIAWQILFH